MKLAAPAAGIALLLLAGPSPAAAQAKPWIHVQVEEARGAKVHVNLPLSLVQVAMRAAPEPIVEGRTLRLGRHGARVKASELRRMWAELRAAGDRELVRVEGEREGETITVSRAGDLVQVRVAGPRSEQVIVDLPVPVVDALLAGEGEELNLEGAIAELGKRRGDVVRVQDERDTIRVWIDEGR